jgi:hypothetical protein
VDNRFYYSFPVEDSRHETVLEGLLSQVADHVPSKKDPSKKVYQLKPTALESFNPFFYYYTREQRDQVEASLMSDERKDTYNQSPPSKMPKLRPLFKVNLRYFFIAENLRVGTGFSRAFLFSSYLDH